MATSTEAFNATKSKKLKINIDPDARVCEECFVPEGSGSTSDIPECARCGMVVDCSKVPRQRELSDAKENYALNAIAAEEECSICLDSLSDASTITLRCTHVFHIACVTDVRKFQLEELCPLCRAPLPGPEELCEEAFRRYRAADILVEQGKASWSTLPPSAQFDLDAALIAWRAAADHGFAEAQYDMGLLYAEGAVVVQSDEEAARWHRMAAEQGHVQAQCTLGDNYFEGRGVVMSDEEAAQWFERAADQGNADGQC